MAQESAGSDGKPLDPPAPVFKNCVVLIEQQRYAEAETKARELVGQFPRSSRAELLMALVYHKQRRFGLAEPHFARAIELNENDYLVRPYFGWCLYNLSKSAEARRMFATFSEAFPDHADAQFALGLLDYEADDLESAAGRFRTAIELAAKKGDKIDEAKSHARLADVQIRREELTEAKRSLERAVELNPELYGAYYKLSVVLQRLGDAEGAAKARESFARVRDRVRPSQDTME